MGKGDSELPKGWAETTIGDVTVSKVLQITPNVTETFKYIDISSIDNELKEIVDSKTLNGDQAPSRARQSIRSKDVLVSMTRPNLNAVTLVPDSFDHAIASTGFDVLRPIEIDPKWLFLHAISKEFVAEMSALVQGALYPAIKSKDIRSYRMPLPPINEQKRIVAKIEELQSHSRRAKEALETIPDLLEQLRQSILASAFRGDLTKKWREQNKGKIEPAAELLKRIRIERRERWEETELEKLKAKGLIGDKLDAQFAKRRKQYKEPVLVDSTGLPELPNGWCWTNIDAILKMPESLSYGILKPGSPEKDGVPMLRVLDIGDGIINDTEIMRVSPELAEEYKRTMLEHGDIVLAVMATIGRAAVIPKEFDGANVNRALAVLKISSLIESYYLLFVLFSPFMVETFRSKTIGTAQPRINLSDLRKMAIPFAPIQEQKIIVNKVKQNREKCRSAMMIFESMTSNLNYLNEAILSFAFRGKLVPQDPDDEPASILLQRIREEAAQRAPKKKARHRTTRKRSHMKKIDKANVLKIIESMPQEVFGFDELRAKLPGDYDALKGILFALLDDPQSGIIQVFDEHTKAMRFRRRAKP